MAGKGWKFTEVTAGDCDENAFEVDAEDIAVQPMIELGLA